MRGIIQANSFSSSDEFNVNEFNKIISDAYATTARGPGFKQKKSFSPSTIGYGYGTCPRYWYLAFSGAEFAETADVQGLANMSNGTAAHTRLQDILERTSILKEVETEVVSEDPPIRGFVDAIIDWKGQDIVGEIKTAKEEVFTIRKATNKPYGSHLLQILVYMRLLQAKWGFLLYENKNTQELWTIPVKMSERNTKLMDRVFDWLRAVKKLHDDQQLPQRPYTKSTIACKSCPVFDTCWSGEKGVLMLQPLEVPK